MRILLVHDYAAPFGGAELHMLELREVFRRRGHDARLFASSAGLDAEARPDYLCRGTTSRYRTLLQTANPWAWRELRRVVKEFRPEVVHVKMFLTQLSPLILPALRGVPALFNVAWYRPICPLGTKVLPDGTLCRSPAGVVCYRQGCVPLRDWAPLMAQMKLWRGWRSAFDAIVANSEATRRRLLADGIEPVEVIWSGVPETPARPPLEDPPLAAFSGRLVREKGVEVLLRAFARLAGAAPEARLVVAGDGPERARLEGLAAQLGIGRSVEMTGQLAWPELEPRLARAWVQAVPSVWEEPFGRAAVESMMRGTAVVASDSGGLSEIVQHERVGLLVRPGDVEALAAALLRLLADRGLAERMGRAGREVAMARLSQEVCAENFLRLYQRLLSHQ